VLSAPNGPRIAAALDRLDFMVSVDVYVNETSCHADVILPGTSPLEDIHYDVAFPQLSYRNHARFSQAVLPRTDDRPAEWEILLRLAAIAGGRSADVDLSLFDDELTAADVRRVAGDHTDAVLKVVSRWRGPERLLDLALRAGPYGDQFGLKPDGLNLKKVQAAPAGIDLGPLAPRIPEILRTPSGCIELAPPLLLSDLARAGRKLNEAAPDVVIIGRRQVRSNNSWMHNLPTLAKGRNRCTALVSPADALRFGLRDGGRARISRGASAIEAQVQVSDEMMPGVISLPHGWGHDLPGARLAVAGNRPGANLNALLEDTVRDPLSGNAVLSGTAVEVSAID